MTKANMQRQDTRYVALLLALAILMLLVPRVSAAEYTASGATKFVFTDRGITVTDGNYIGYKIEGTELTINGTGTYIVSGSCSDGSIKVKKGTTGVTLVLNSLTLTSAATAPIACNKSTEVNLVAVSGTSNTLTDSAKNNDDNYPDNEDAENAVLKCKDGSQVTISGSGALILNAKGKNGIKSGATTDEEGTASLTIRDVSLTINASVNDAINAEQTLNIESGTLTISAADDAIHSDYVLNIGASGTAGPTIKITSCYEGLEAATLYILSGNLSITATDDCLNAANSDLTGYSFSMNISGGTINAYTSSGDGFDSNGTLTISGGTVNVWSANTADNQPLDADGTITISGGTVLAAGGSSGMGMNLSASQAYVTFGGSSMGGGNMGGQPGSMGVGPGGRASGNSGSSSASVTKGSTISIKNGSSSVFSTTALCNASYIFFSSPSLTSGTSYTLYSGSTSVSTATAQTGSSQSGGMQPGNGQQPGATQHQQRPSAAPAQDSNANSGNSSGSADTSGSSSAGSTANAASGNRFSDVSTGSWYYDAVQYVYSAGLMSGTGSYVFSPDGATTRGMIVTILYRLEGSPACGSASFSDVSSGKYYAQAVAWAAENGIVSGYSASRFGPENAITREQLAAILYRYAAYKGYDVSDLASLTSYVDNSLVASYAKTPFAWAVQAGIISGTGANRLSPSAGATRAQAAAMLMRFCQSHLSV